jgi:hypothetical protein
MELTVMELLCLIEHHAAGKLSFGPMDKRIAELANALADARLREQQAAIKAAA